MALLAPRKNISTSTTLKEGTFLNPQEKWIKPPLSRQFYLQQSQHPAH